MHDGLIHDGEVISVPERVIVSPSSGVFHPSPVGPAGHIEAGATIGHIEACGRRVEVTSPFGGRLMAVVALEGERVATHDRLAWLRAA
jgi:biotin carboxyl carrier protein